MSNHCFKLSYQIDNTNDTPIYVTVKGGLSYEIGRPAKPQIFKNNSIKVTLSNVDLAILKVNSKEATTQLDLEIMQQIELWLEKEKHRVIGNSSNNYEFTTVIELGHRHTVENDVIHSEMLGITLFADIKRSDLHARNTPKATLEALDDEELKDNSLTTSIQLVDPENRYGVLWVNMLGKATKLASRNDLNTAPGIYIVNRSNGGIERKVYLDFTEINEKTLQENAIFLTKRECELQGGNTEKTLNLEKQLKESLKSIDIYAEDANRQIGKIAQLEIKLSHLASNIGRLKESYTIKEATQKSEFNMLKLKSQQDGFGSLVKNASAVLGLGMTVYKLMA